jgi:hypothetical protein
MLNWIRRTWFLLLLVVCGLVLYGDFSALRLTIYNLSALGLVILVVDLLLDRREQWGIFPSLDLDAVLRNAISTPISAAITWIGLAILIVAIMVLAIPKLSIGAQISDRARPYLPVLTSAINEQWPAMPQREMAAGQTEQESSWKQTATLKTSRELGRGLVQLTIAYNKDGKERFNAYQDAVRLKALSKWDWRNDPYNARYQLTYLVLTDKANFATVRRYMVNDVETWKASLVCYNAGQGRWLARKAMAKQMGLPVDRWTGGLEQAHGTRENSILYGRPLWQAVNEYPRVIFGRSEKYRGVV